MNNKISLLRVIAIITVVFGHSIILYSSEWNLMETTTECSMLDYIKQGINLYQMQLYFFISGFLMYYSVLKETSVKDFIKKKIIRLIIPYFMFGLLWMIPIKGFLDIPSYHGLSVSSIIYNFVIGINNGHLWFLYSLFLLFATLYPLNKKLAAYKWGG